MFIISKIIGFLIDPTLWIVTLLALAFFSRRRGLKRKLYSSSALLFLVFTNPFLVNNLSYRYQSKATELTEGETFDTAILLGGLAGLDEVRNKGVFKEASDRFIQTARLYETGKVRKILITGGDSRIFRKQQYREADFLAENLVDLRIPAKDILVENDSRNTLENARFSKRILDSVKAQGPYLLVTSAMHMPRAVKAFSKENIHVKPFPCHFTVTGTNTHFNAENMVPRAYCLSLWKTLLKECLGNLQLMLFSPGVKSISAK